MVSASTVSQEVLDAFTALKSNQLRYLIAQNPEGSNDVNLVAQGDNDKTFDDFKADLPEDDARFAVYNLAWTHSDGRKMTKLVFINYVPDGCKKMAIKFQYANLKDSVKASFNPINKEMQINDRLDLDEAEW